MTNHPLNFGIVGSGAIAGIHAAAIQLAQGAELISVSSRSAESAEAFAKQHGIRFAASLKDLLADTSIDAVAISTPSGTHSEIAIQALEAGKHVLCEKPLDISTKRADAMIEAARKADRVLAGIFQMRFGYGARQIRSAVADGRFGNISLCSVYLKWWRDPSYYSTSSWKGTAAMDGGAALINQGIHGVDLLQYLVGMPERISAQVRTRTHDIEMEDTVAAYMEFPTGALGVIEAATSCYPGTPMRIEVSGSAGSAILEEDRIVKWEFAESRPEDEEIRRGREGKIGGGQSDPMSISNEGHKFLVEDMVQAIQEGRRPLVDGIEARKAVAIVEAVYQSAKTGSPVSPR